MKRNAAKIIAFLFAVIFLTASFPYTAFAAASPDVQSDKALLYNIKYDKLLFEKNTADTLYPASFTKLMTAYLGFEYYKSNKDKTVTVQKEMLSGVGGTTMELKAGEEIAFYDLLKGLVISNANDAALVIACTVSHSVAEFVELMNKTALEFGMEETYYGNPTGIDSAVMHTTLSDTLKICKAVYKINDFMVMSSLDTAEVKATNKSRKRTLYNKNLMIAYSYVLDYYLKNTKGMIAGYTPEAGYCIACCYEGNDGMMMAIVSGGKDLSEKKNGSKITSYYDAKNLFKYGDDAFNAFTVAKKDDIVCEKKVLLGDGLDHVLMAVKDDLDVLVPSAVSENAAAIKKDIILDFDTLTAPVIKGAKYGSIVYSYSGEIIAQSDIVALSGVNRSLFLTIFNAITKFFSRGAPLAIVIIIASGFVIYVISLIAIVAVNNARKNREKNKILARLNEEENSRLKIVAAKEKSIRQKRRRRVARSLKEVMNAFSGDDSETYTVKKSPAKNKKPPNK